MRRKNSPGCKCCNTSCHIGPCAESVPDVLVLDDLNLGLTLPFLFTPDSPSIPCVGKWVAYDMVEFGGSSHPIFGDCPAATVAVRWRMTLPSTTGGNPLMEMSWHRSGSCPSGGSIPDGSWDTVIPGGVGPGYGINSWNCPPGFAADFRVAGNFAIYNYAPAQILVSTPP